MGTKINKLRPNKLVSKPWSVSLLTFFKKNFWLILIFALALFLRTYKLDIYPEAIDEDEMSLGYISYSLLTKGTDEHGVKFPIYFQSVGDYKYGLYSYFSMLPISLLGLNTFSTRLTSAVFGSLSILVIYILAVELFKEKKYGLITSAILSVSPLHIHFSRIAYSNIFGSFWVLITILIYIKIIKNFNFKMLFVGLTSLLLSIYSYQAYRVLLPILLVTIPFLYVQDFKNNLFKKIIFPILGVLVIALSFINPQSRVRSSNTTTLINTPALVENFSEDNIAGVSLLTTRVIHNKLTVFTFDFVKRYFSYFDPKFLFLDTASFNQRHGISWVGVVYLIEIPFFIFGLIKLKSYFPLLLLTVSPIAASLVVDSVSPTRSIFIVYPMVLISGYGIYYLLGNLSKWKVVLYLVIGFGFLLNFMFFVHQYTVHKVYHHPWYSDVGLKEMANAIEKVIDQYDHVVVSGGHYISFLFYYPNKFSLRSLNNKFIFHMPNECPAIGKPKTLYVCFDYRLPKASRLIEVIRYRDGQPAILLIDFDGKQETLPSGLKWGDEIPTYKLNEKDYWPTNNSR